MTFYGISYSLKTKINNMYPISYSFKIKNKKMVKAVDSNKNSSIVEIGTVYTLPLNKNSKVNFSAYLTEESKDKEGKLDIDKTVYKYKVVYGTKLFDKYSADLGYQYSYEKFKDMYGFHNVALKEKREDIVHTVSLKLSAQINNKQSVSMEMSQINNDTNHDAYSYDKKAVSVSYTTLF